MLTALYVLQFIVSVLLILMVMFQKTEGGTGLVSSNQYNSFFANKALVSNPLTRITIILGAIFFLNSIAIGALTLTKSRDKDNVIEKINELQKEDKQPSVPLDKK